MPESVAPKLKQLRERAGLTVRQLADAIGRPPSSYSTYEGRFKRDNLPVELVRDLDQVMVGLGEPPISRLEVWELAGVVPLDLLETDASRAGPLPVTTQAILDELGELDGLSIRAIREALVALPDCPPRLKSYEARADALRENLRLRIGGSREIRARN